MRQRLVVVMNPDLMTQTRFAGIGGCACVMGPGQFAVVAFLRERRKLKASGVRMLSTLRINRHSVIGRSRIWRIFPS
jgi:hypothetical protein